MNHRSFGLALIGLAAAAGACGSSLQLTGSPQPVPQADAAAAAARNLESRSAGSSSLVPPMAADMRAEAQAARLASVEAASHSGDAAGRTLDDIAFVRQAIDGGREQLIAARDALAQLRDPQLQRVAQMLVHDHSDANARLARLAASKGWSLPPPRPLAMADAAGAASDFDARWTAAMISAHERAVPLYRAQARGGEDRQLRDYARDSLPTLEHHLAELRSLQQ